MITMNTTKKRIIEGILSAVIIAMFYNIVQPLQEASALQRITIATQGTVQLIQGNLLKGTIPVFIDIEKTTWVRVTNANNSNTIALFNMTNALMNGFNISYAPLDLACNSTDEICVVGYTTQGTGTCAFSPNLCKDRLVLIDYGNNVWSSLKNGANYTHSSQTIFNNAFSFGQTQYNVFDTWGTTGGGPSKIDTWVFNTTDGVDSHPLVFGNTFDTTTTATYSSWTKLATLPVAGVNHNFMIMGVASGTSLQFFDRGFNTVGCSVSVGGIAPRDGFVATDTITNQQFVYIIENTVVKKIDSSCNIVASADLTASTGGNALNSITVDSTRHEIYTQSNGNVFVVNQTSMSTTPITTQASLSANSGLHDNLAPYSNGNNGALMVGSTAVSTALIIYWNQQGASGSSGSNTGQTVCFDTNPTGSASNLVCITCPGTFGTPQAVSAQCPHGFPSPNANGNIPPAFRGSLNGTQQLNVYGCSLGWFSCTNTNTQTNGEGFAFLILLIVLTTIIILYATYRTGHDINNVTFPIVLCDTLWCGVTWQTNITGNLPFYVAILVLAGFAGVKIYSKVTGGGESA